MTETDPTREASERMKRDHLAAGLPVVERNHNHTSRAPCGPSCPMPGLGWNGRGLVIDRFESAGEGAVTDSSSTDPVEALRRIADQDIGGNAPWLADELHGFADRLAASMRADSPQSCYFWDIRAGECHFEMLVPGCSPCAACPGGDAPDVARHYSFTRAGLVDALAHLEVSVPATGSAVGMINAESMADAIIEALRSETEAAKWERRRDRAWKAQ